MKKTLFILLLMIGIAFCDAAEIEIFFEKAVFTVLDEYGEPFDHPADSQFGYLGSNPNLQLRVDSTQPWKVADLKLGVKTAERTTFVEYLPDSSLTQFYEFTPQTNTVTNDITYIHFLLTDKNLDTDEGVGVTRLIVFKFEQTQTGLYIKVEVVTNE